MGVSYGANIGTSFVLFYPFSGRPSSTYEPTLTLLSSILTSGIWAAVRNRSRVLSLMLISPLPQVEPKDVAEGRWETLVWYEKLGIPLV
jgi:hypothetical protein